MYTVIIKKSAEKYVQKQQPYIRNAFFDWIENELKNTPFEANNGKMINAYYNDLEVYKKRFGSFRALYTIDKDMVIVEVYKFESRGSVYK